MRVRASAAWFVMGFAVCASAPAEASDDAPPALWRTIAAGDDAPAVARKLELMPEVKSARVKSNGGIAVSYRGAGLAIGDETFKLMPEFAGGRLQRLSLQTDPTCALKVEDRYNHILAMLALTHTTSATRRLDTAALDDAVLQATEANPIDLKTVRTNAQSAAVVTLRFTRREAPSATGSLNGTMATTQDVWRKQSYEAMAADCDGTGATRLRFILSYMTNAELVDAGTAVAVP